MTAIPYFVFAISLLKQLKLGTMQTPPMVNRVPHIPMLKENNIRKGFFEHGEFITLRSALPSYLKGFVTFAYKTGWRVSEMAGFRLSLNTPEAHKPADLVRILPNH
jgi:hypothetical protein